MSAMKHMTPEMAFTIVSRYYEGKSTKSFDVPYMNHITEGLKVLRAINADDITLIVYTLHPIFQGEPEPKKVIMMNWTAPVDLETNLFDLCAEYAVQANAYLKRHHTIGAERELPDMHQSIFEALLADKIQNNKDFRKYHLGVHKDSDLLEDYFRCWLVKLVPDEAKRAELTKLIERKQIVVFTGAGISAESGIKTFRDDDGTWETENIHDVATPAGWKKDRERVLNFYNARIAGLSDVVPNDAHKLLADLEEDYDVVIITQNVDDLHERAGSSRVIHLHGELLKKSSSMNKEAHITDLKLGETIELGTKAPDGSQWRPYIVWFGEMVPLMDLAMNTAKKADILIVVGTSLQVYPAANIALNSAYHTEKYFVDPNVVGTIIGFQIYDEVATTGVRKIYEKLTR